MKLLSLLIALAIIAYAASSQLSSDSPNASNRAIDELRDKEKIVIPNAPTTPQGLKEFEKDVNSLVEDAAAKRKKQYE